MWAQPTPALGLPGQWAILQALRSPSQASLLSDVINITVSLPGALSHPEGSSSPCVPGTQASNTPHDTPDQRIAGGHLKSAVHLAGPADCPGGTEAVLTLTRV